MLIQERPCMHAAYCSALEFDLEETTEAVEHRLRVCLHVLDKAIHRGG